MKPKPNVIVSVLYLCILLAVPIGFLASSHGWEHEDLCSRR